MNWQFDIYIFIRVILLREMLYWFWEHTITEYLLFRSKIRQLTANSTQTNAPKHTIAIAWAKRMVKPKIPCPFLLAPAPQLRWKFTLPLEGMHQFTQRKSLFRWLYSFKNPWQLMHTYDHGLKSQRVSDHVHESSQSVAAPRGHLTTSNIRVTLLASNQPNDITLRS